jgi:hypothetical protein
MRSYGKKARSSEHSNTFKSFGAPSLSVRMFGSATSTFPLMTILPCKGLLALAVVVEVALQTDGRPISAKTLATRHGLPSRHLELVLQSLVRGGMWSLASPPCRCGGGTETPSSSWDFIATGQSEGERTRCDRRRNAADHLVRRNDRQATGLVTSIPPAGASSCPGPRLRRARC